MSKEPRNPYRKWEARPYGSLYDLYTVEPDGFQLLMCIDLTRDEAKRLAEERTNTEREAQLAREKEEEALK